MDNDTTQKEYIYQIKISGLLDQRWIDWFNQMQVTIEMIENGNPRTVLTGPLVDQVALRGLMTRIWDLNFELISVQRLEGCAQELGGTSDETDD